MALIPLLGLIDHQTYIAQRKIKKKIDQTRPAIHVIRKDGLGIKEYLIRKNPLVETESSRIGNAPCRTDSGVARSLAPSTSIHTNGPSRKPRER